MRFITHLAFVVAFAASLVVAEAPVQALEAAELSKRADIFVANPYCDHYKCRIQWKQGQKIMVSWIDAPKGGVRVYLVPETDKTLQRYLLTPTPVGSRHLESQCFKGTGQHCGMWNGELGANVKPGEYSIHVVTVAQPKRVGYTDVIKVSAAAASAPATSSKRRLDA